MAKRTAGAPAPGRQDTRPQAVAFRNGQRAGTHGRNQSRDRCNARRKAIREASA